MSDNNITNFANYINNLSINTQVFSFHRAAASLERISMNFKKDSQELVRFLSQEVV